MLCTHGGDDDLVSAVLPSLLSDLEAVRDSPLVMGVTTCDWGCEVSWASDDLDRQQHKPDRTDVLRHQIETRYSVNHITCMPPLTCRQIFLKFWFEVTCSL